MKILRDKLRPFAEKGGTFLYGYLRASDKSPYYIGVSTGLGRAVDQKNHRKHGISVPKNADFVVVLRSGLTKEQAAEWEQFYISHYGRIDLQTGILRNRTDGGEGMQNPSPETRAKISAATKGRVLTPEHVAALSAFGRLPKTEEHKRRISDGQPTKGKTFPLTQLQNIKAAKASKFLREAQAAGFNTADDYRIFLRKEARRRSTAIRDKKRGMIKALGMSERTFKLWVADGRPDDATPYLKRGLLARSLTVSL